MKYNFATWRKKMGWTQEEACKQLEIGNRTYRRYENTQKGPWLKVLILACKQLEKK